MGMTIIKKFRLNLILFQMMNEFKPIKRRKD